MTYLADRLRFVFEVFNHRGDNEDAAEESPGLLEILTPVKLNFHLLKINNSSVQKPKFQHS